ncbi:hypothetical protein ACRCJS_08245 [Aerococcus urinaeequi]|uniref:hypothetical protein n=1 Tax=Aerococcus urinaeequi TaxID=51665 RepID=UPI003D6A5DAA
MNVGFRGAVIGLIDPTYKVSIKELIDCISKKHPEIKEKYAVNFCQTDDGSIFIDVEDLA